MLGEIAMQLTFQEVVRDSRCPTGVACAWSGIVDVHVLAEMASQRAQQLLLGGVTNSEGWVLGSLVEASGPTAAWYAGYTISLLRVAPYPTRAQGDIPPQAYAVTLVVAKAASPGPTPASGSAPSLPTDPDGLPVLCLSERTLTLRLAGASADSPIQLTPPVAARRLNDKATLTAYCEAFVGPDFHAAEAGDLTGVWTEELPWASCAARARRCSSRCWTVKRCGRWPRIRLCGRPRSRASPPARRCACRSR